MVAEHVFGVCAEVECFELMGNYAAFGCKDTAAEEAGKAFVMTISEGETPVYAEELRQEDEEQEIICGRTNDGRHVFEFRWWQQTAGWLVCNDGYHDGRLVMAGMHQKMAIDNALMVLYALATANRLTMLFHAAVVSLDGKGYMFLGKSGTGKSTHARLWLQHIKGAELVNDDNPVVRLYDDGRAIVYGSPWSGKTPCYRNVAYALKGIVILSQAPYNKIHRLDGLNAYAALVSSISGKRWDKAIADGLHQSENRLVQQVAIWHLECLPDREAALLCRKEAGHDNG